MMDTGVTAPIGSWRIQHTSMAPACVLVTWRPLECPYATLVCMTSMHMLWWTCMSFNDIQIVNVYGLCLCCRRHNA